MLSAFDIKYMPQTNIKGQVLAYLVTEFTEDFVGDEMLGSKILVVFTPSLPSWEVYTNGVVNQKGSGVGIFLISTEKITVEKSLRFGFLATNNEAEYEALLAGMEMVNKLGGKVVEVFLDSRLVVRQVNGEFGARDQRMQGYLIKIRKAQSSFETFSIR